MRASAVISYRQVAVSSSVLMTVAAARLLDVRTVPQAIHRSPMMAVASVLLGLCLVLAQPEQMAVSARYVEEVSVAPLPWVSNFITSDGRYLLLADGRIFFCREES